MNISHTSKERCSLVVRLIHWEVRSTRAVHNSSDAVAGQHLEDAREARNRLLPLLREVEDLRDIDIILLIERSFLTLELEYLTAMPRKISSLNLAISQLDATVNLLRAIRSPGAYQSSEPYFTLDRNLINGLPNDEARQFFRSHAKRLGDLGTGRWEGTEAELIKARISNVRVAQKVYTELQEQALAPYEVREAPALYAA